MRDLLTALPFEGELTEAQKRLVEEGTTMRQFAAGEMIRECDASCLGLLYVRTGKIRAYLMSEEGREITLFSILPGQFCVLSASCVIRQITFDTMLEAEEATDVRILRAGAFEQLTSQNVYARCFLYEMATERFSEVMWIMQQMLFLRFDRRLAGFLLEEASEDSGKEVHLTQEAIARRLNSAREVVARMLHQFSDEGIISVSRGRIRIMDEDSMKKIAGL